MPTILLIRALGESPNSADPVPQFLRSYGYAPVQLTLTSGNSHIHEGNHSLETRFIAQGSLGGRSMGMLIDSGCGISLIESRHLGSPVERTKMELQGNDLLGAKLAARERVKLEPIVLGDCRFTAQPAEVVEHFTLARNEDDAPVGSLIQRRMTDSERPKLILGWDFLSRNMAWLDCPRHTLYFIGALPTEQRRLNMATTLTTAGFDVVQMATPHVYQGIVPAQVGDKSFLVLVDTGASFTLFDEDQIAPMGLKIHSLHSTIGGAKGTSRSLSWAALPAFQIGSHRVEKFEVGMTSLKGFNKPRQDAGASPLLGVLGMDYLLREGALIDFQGGAIYFQRMGVTGR